jgi:glycosyltransferase involved in cell wall biosynthesis
VSDYTKLVAAGLAQLGDEVHVWCGPYRNADPQPETPGVVVHRALGSLSPADLREVGDQLDKFPAPRRLLVQWVPHAYGYRAMNVGFCRWLSDRATRSGDTLEIMAHECFLRFGRTWKQTVAAAVQRWMTIVLLRHVERVWVSIPEWVDLFRPYTLGRRVIFEQLPIPSNIPVVHNPEAAKNVRRRYAPQGQFLIGHFGTHGWPITSFLEPILSLLADDPSAPSILLMGAGSEKFGAEVSRRHPALGRLVHSTGDLSAEDLSAHLSACDLLIQPYPDGVSSRRGTMMAGLAHGKPIVTTYGPLSAPFWKQAAGLALAPVDDPVRFMKLVRELAGDPAALEQMGRAAKSLYDERFDLSHTVHALREAAILEYSTCAS